MNHSRRKKLLVALAGIVTCLFGVWGYLTVMRELMYESFYHPLVGLLLCIGFIFPILGGFLIFGTLIALVHKFTKSYIVVSLEILAIVLAFQLPVQAFPEVRYFTQYRGDYESIRQAVELGQLTEDKMSYDCIREFLSIEVVIEGRHYCVATTPIEITVVRRANGFIAMVYAYDLSYALAHPCRSIMRHEGSLVARTGSRWFACHWSFYPN